MFIFIGVEDAFGVTGVIALGISGAVSLGVSGLVSLWVTGDFALVIVVAVAYVFPGVVSLESAIFFCKVLF